MKFFHAGLAVVLLAGGAFAADAVVPLEFTLEVVGPDKPSSFPKLLYVHVNNPGYAPVNLAQSIIGSELIIDGKASQRVPKPFLGTQGLAPMGEWDGCFSFDQYQPMITPGKHKIALRMTGIQSAETKVRWNPPVPWEKGDMKSRFKEIQQLALALNDGLPQSCAEQWLTRKDGGSQEEDKIRYVLEPQFKMSVPYRQMYAPSGMHAVVDGPPKIYTEQAL